MAQPFSVVHVLVSGEPPEHGLPQHADQSMSAVLAGAGVGEALARHGAEAERVVEFAVGKQTSIGGHDRTAKLELQSAVEIEPERLASIPRRVRHDISSKNQLNTADYHS